MFKRLIAPVLAAALALTPLAAAPARADNDAAKWILGLTTLAIIAGAVDAANDHDHHYYPPPRPVYPPPAYHPRPPVVHQPAYWLPASCQFTVNTRYGAERVLGRSCLIDNRVSVRDLPDRCQLLLRTSSGNRNAFSSNCLSQSGYQIGARRW